MQGPPAHYSAPGQLHPDVTSLPHLRTHVFEGWVDMRDALCLSQEVFLTEDHLCIVMELAAGGDLATYMEQMSVLTVR